MELWQAIVLGVVQGLTEFLPISSSGHLIIFPWLFGWDTGGLAFDASLHLGTLAAVLVYFRHELINLVRAIPYALSRPLPILKGESGDEPRDMWAQLGLIIVIMSIPGGIVGLLFVDQIDAFFHTDENSTRAIAVIASMLIIVGLFMLLAERTGRQEKQLRNVGVTDAIWVGIAQALAALIPGTSRSGATITAGLFRGLTRPEAARLSFLGGVPLIAAAGLLSLMDAIQEGMSGSEVNNFIAGGLAAAIVGFFAVSGLIRFLQRQSTLVFVIYRIIFGIFLFIMLVVR
jgi:undecaprenyl-diphosphatase